ncbi:endonuclease domain-containing protein [Paludisphaera sp.]|uniref:endonuclease domain-containing protein n=1 Tax=Paludisphaera sp. TaxID=2017432 RepID=UPI00301E52A7
MPNNHHPTDPESLRRARRLRREATRPEQLLWAALRNGRLAGAKFRRQVVLGEYILDFYSAEHGLVVEIDGESHEDRGAYDSRRDEWLRARGLRVVRYTNDDVLAELDGVLEGIRRLLISSSHRAE